MAEEVLNQGGPTTLNYQDVAVNIVYRFIDVLQAAAIIIIGLFAIRYIRRYLQKIEAQHEAQRTALNLLEKLISGFLIVITVTLALKIVGLDLTLIISALTLGFSFGLRDILRNYISGILILFKSPFVIGDIVKIRSYIGKVEKIEFQSTTLKTFDKREVTIYNKDVLTQSIVNFSKELERRIEITVLFGHGTDLKRAFKILAAILENHPKVLKTPKYSLIFRKFTDHGATMAIRFWVKRPCNILKIRSELATQIQNSFDEASIISPFGREVQFTADVGMTNQRQERLRVYYAQPALAAIAMQTNGEVVLAAQEAGTAGTGGSGGVGASETIGDEDEPEEF